MVLEVIVEPTGRAETSATWRQMVSSHSVPSCARVMFGDALDIEHRMNTVKSGTTNRGEAAREYERDRADEQKDEGQKSSATSRPEYCERTGNAHKARRPGEQKDRTRPAQEENCGMGTVNVDPEIASRVRVLFAVELEVMREMSVAVYRHRRGGRRSHQLADDVVEKTATEHAVVRRSCISAPRATILVPTTTTASKYVSGLTR